MLQWIYNGTQLKSALFVFVRVLSGDGRPIRATDFSPNPPATQRRVGASGAAAASGYVVGVAGVTLATFMCKFK